MQFDRHSQLGEMQLAAAVEAAEYNLVATLGLAPYPDGDQWCVLWGKNLQDGVCGFGETPYLAVLAFNKACHSPAVVQAEATQ
jgi:hypothetical protein